MRNGMLLRLLAAACVVSATLLAPASSATTPYNIDVVLNETGANAFTGQTEVQAIKLYEAAANKQGGINGQPVHFTFYDDQTDPKTAVEVANQLLAKHPAVILGSGQTATCAAIAPLLQTSGPVAYCLTSGYSPKPHGYVFSASASLHTIVPAEYRFALGKGWRRVAYISVTNASGQNSDIETKYAFSLPEFSSMKMVAQETFNPTDISVAALVARVKATNPDVIVSPASGPAFGTLMHGLNDAGLHLPVIGSSANLHPEQLKEYASFLPSELYFNGLVYYARDILKRGPLLNATNDFFAAYKAAGLVPTPDSGQGWDPPLIVVSALRKLGTNATADQIRDYILNLHDFAGVNGIYDFRDGDPHGLGSNAVIFVKWHAATNDFTNVTKLGGAPL
jgi:branched-chain amino acid transport system substrate-binding protein